MIQLWRCLIIRETWMQFQQLPRILKTNSMRALLNTRTGSSCTCNLQLMNTSTALPTLIRRVKRLRLPVKWTYPINQCTMSSWSQGLIIQCHSRNYKIHFWYQSPAICYWMNKLTLQDRLRQPKSNPEIRTFSTSNCLLRQVHRNPSIWAPPTEQSGLAKTTRRLRLKCLSKSTLSSINKLNDCNSNCNSASLAIFRNNKCRIKLRQLLTSRPILKMIFYQ